METSGHAALRENYFLDDGAYLITKIIIMLVKLRKEGKTIADLIADLPIPLEEREIRFRILENDFREYGQKVIDDFAVYAEDREGWTVADDNHEGLRVSLDKKHGDGWMLLRMSVHDPILPFNAESNSEGGVEKINSEFNRFICNYDKIKC